MAREPATHEFILRVLRAFDFGDGDSIWWRTDGEYAPVTFLVNCNDEFYWGCADCEEVTPRNIGILEQSIADCKEATKGKSFGAGTCSERGSTVYAPMLFCARVRKMRPQGAVYPGGDDHAGVRLLLDACGPPRDVDLHNPRPAPVA